MSICGSTRQPDPSVPPMPIVARANYVQFAPGQWVEHQRLKSRLAVHCRAGAGVVTVNGDVFELVAGQLLWVPWGCHATYVGDVHEPFFLAGVHLIPHARPGSPVVRDVSHVPGDVWDHNPDHTNVRVPGSDHTLHMTLGIDHPVSALMDYCVRRFESAVATESMLRCSAQLLWDDLTALYHTPPVAARPLPPHMQQLMQYVRDQAHTELTLEQLAEFTQRSVSWLHRQFAQWIGQTPGQYIIAQRIENAKRLLATTTMPIGRVGESVGVPDPYYFSKLFKQHQGVSPSRYRKQSSLM